MKTSRSTTCTGILFLFGLLGIFWVGCEHEDELMPLYGMRFILPNSDSLLTFTDSLGKIRAQQGYSILLCDSGRAQVDSLGGYINPLHYVNYYSAKNDSFPLDTLVVTTNDTPWELKQQLRENNNMRKLIIIANVLGGRDTLFDVRFNYHLVIDKHRGCFHDYTTDEPVVHRIDFKKKANSQLVRDTADKHPVYGFTFFL